MKRLNGMDAMLLYSETPSLHTHTIKVAIVDAASLPGVFNYEGVRRAVQERLPLLEPLRYRLVEIPFKLHHPMWLRHCAVDLDYHIRHATVPAPGGRRELDGLIGEIASTPLDRRRPLWEFHVVDGLEDGRFALIGKIHHALADGVASANLLARLLDPATATPAGLDRPDTSSPQSNTPSRSALLRAAVRDHLRLAIELPRLMIDMVGGLSRLWRISRSRHAHPDVATVLKPPPTFLNHVVSPGRTFATAVLSLADVKQTAKCLGVTFNDIILSMVAEGLRELLLRKDGRADRPILASVPVSTDKNVHRITGNELSGFITSLPVHVDDPLERVRLTALGTQRAKADHDAFGPSLPGRMMTYLPPPVAPTVFRWQGKRATKNRLMNIAVSNVAGPRERGFIAGAPVTEIYSVGVLSPGSALNVTVWSYVDQLDIAVLSDDHTFQDTHEATSAIVRGFAEIRRAAGLSGELSEVPRAMASVDAGGS
ncbi:diacylglycerol O-acyltransferase [Mycobacteriaceae bacterium 1482268.1]|nr:diacylglycerol O-acyltransferase [Mycobacteriaceae bacterium 1482268.1]